MDRSQFEALDRSDDLAAMRNLYDLPERPIYLDGNSLGAPSSTVLEANRAGVSEWATALVGGWPHWIELPRSVGDRIGQLVGAAPGQVVVCDSVTVNLYKLAWAALDARPGRTSIVADASEFPTDRYVLEGIAQRAGAGLRLIPSDPVQGVEPDRLIAAVDETTALVCLSQVHYRSGARLDMHSITDLVHQFGALMLWDLSHSAGALPIDLDTAGVDLAVGCTYKYIGAGPGAPGFLYVNRELPKELRQPIWGWFGQADQFAMGDGYRPAAAPDGFLTGTPSVLGLKMVDAAVGLLIEAGIESLWAKSQKMTAALVSLVEEELVPLGAVLATPSDPHRRGAHVSVSHPRAWPWCATLIDRSLVVGDFRTPDVLRLGPAPMYVRFVDLFDAVEAMSGVLAEGLPDVFPASRVT